ncbi:hypothetical protein [Phocaeicola barnesiae]|uniref:hypothetical protein n=1 Tax=Phocaeicola barnesiae TaxID=376804 RepID=UPI0025A45C26|nr:hypothetical protein [Phocaeicola barnesiae]MDM8309398.1 hypothetical protein [Phocaeicola barnesiae]
MTGEYTLFYYITQRLHFFPSKIPQELLDSPEINKAVLQIEESAYSDAQLWGYDEFWDAVRVEKTLVSDAERKGMEKGMAKGIEKGIEKGIAQGQSNERKETARRMKNDGIPPETIAKYTQLSIEEIEKL